MCANYVFGVLRHYRCVRNRYLFIGLFDRLLFMRRINYETRHDAYTTYPRRDRSDCAPDYVKLTGVPRDFFSPDRYSTYINGGLAQTAWAGGPRGEAGGQQPMYAHHAMRL